MKKLSGILCLFLILSAPLLAQDSKEIMDDWFYANTNNWPIYDNGNTKSTLEKGYTLESFLENGSYISKETALDYSKNFSIELKASLESGDNNTGYGLLFGFKDWDNYYRLMIAETGYYRIDHVDQGTHVTTGWVKSNNIFTKGLANELKIVKVNDWIGFYINNLFTDMKIDSLAPFYVDKIRADGFAGKEIGFLTNGKIKIRIQQLTIKELGTEEESKYMGLMGLLADDKKTVTLLEDDFSSNLNNWTDENVAGKQAAGVKDGSYSFDKFDKSGRMIKQNVFIASGSDYEIQCRTKHISGSDSSKYGFAWGFKDWSNYQEFGIDKKGICRYLYAIKGTEKSLTASFKPQEENRLRVSRKRDSLYFYVNDALVIKAPDLSPAGSYAGLLVYEIQKVLFDDLKITQVRSIPTEYDPLTVGEETIEKNEGVFSGKASADDISADWEPGLVTYTHKSDKGYAFWKDYYLNPNDDFSISEKLKWVEGDSTRGYGLIWGYRNWDNYNIFLIAKDGSFKCEIVHNKDVISTGWRHSKAFAANDENTLEVKRLGSIAEYYINGKLAATMPFYELYGYSDGIIIYGEQTVGLRNLTVKSIPVEMPELEPGMVTGRDDYINPSAAGNAGSGDESARIENSRLYLSAQYPELEEDSDDGYPSNRMFCFGYHDVLPTVSNIPVRAFSVEATVGLTKNYKNWGAGIRVGGVNFLVDINGKYTITDLATQKPLSDEDKAAGTRFYRLKVFCTVTGLTYFYINGKMVGVMKTALTDRDTGPVISAFNKTSEAWFDDYRIRTYSSRNLLQ